MDLSRQSNIIKRSPAGIKMLIIGAGGIGSNAAYMAACMGIGKITVYDPDDVGEENIAPQFYGVPDVGLSKALTLAVSINNTIGERVVKGVPERYVNQRERANIVLIGVDSLQKREDIWIENDIRWDVWLDGRMGGTMFTLYTVTRDREKAIRYMDSLKATEMELACGMKATAFITKGMAQGVIGQALYKIINGNVDHIPEVMFYDAVTMFPWVTP